MLSYGWMNIFVQIPERIVRNPFLIGSLNRPWNLNNINTVATAISFSSIKIPRSHSEVLFELAFKRI